ncbi:MULTISPECIES: LSM domain-containing protein [Saliphagus]|uniref:LSM domain-containing protein n=1 Tax=Saliphagus infecundisoli TaxID=1849069 RepID=A0ABD5QJP4_9EURY|nr:MULTISPECIES: LSM domain-containing protein [Saliphagus]
MSGRPLDVLEASLGERVSVRLKSGDEYVGDLTGYDQHMNLVLEEVSIPVESTVGEEPPTEDTTIIRGDNVVSITP